MKGNSFFFSSIYSFGGMSKYSYTVLACVTNKAPMLLTSFRHTNVFQKAALKADMSILFSVVDAVPNIGLHAFQQDDRLSVILFEKLVNTVFLSRRVIGRQ